MSGKKAYQKSIKDASKFRRLEVEVLLGRYVENFEYDDGTGQLPEVNVNEITNLLRVAYTLVQSSCCNVSSLATTPGTPGSTQTRSSQSLSAKEIDLTLRLYLCLRQDPRPALVTAQGLSEAILIGCGAQTTGYLPSGTQFKLTSTRLLALLNYYIPPAKTRVSDTENEEEMNTKFSNGLVDLLVHPRLTPREQSECLVLLTRLQMSECQPMTTESAVSTLYCLTECLKATEVIQSNQSQLFGERTRTQALDSKKSARIVTELDGGPCQDRFTILNTARHFTQTQLAHFDIVPLLGNWLSHVAFIHGLPVSGDNRSPLPTDKLLTTLTAAVSEISAYASRVLDQCEINLKFPGYKELIMCALFDVIELVRLICDIDNSHVPKFYIRFTGLFNRCHRGELPPATAIKLIRFLIHHADAMGKEVDSFLNVVFTEMLGQRYSNSDFCQEIINYCLSDSDKLCAESGVTVRFFPSILKILAWNPRAYLPQFVSLLPLFMDPSLLLELLHTLLDLPCISATMQLCKALSSSSSTNSGELRAMWDNSLNQSYIRFLMRAESGRGDTLAHMDQIFVVLGSFRSDLRVQYTSGATVKLLQVFFDVVFQSGLEEHEIGDIVPLILERSILLFGPASHVKLVNDVFADALLNLLRQYPGLVFTHFKDIREYLGQGRSILTRTARAIYTALLAGLGHSCSMAYQQSTSSMPSKDDAERTDKLARLYETLECTLYELIGACTQDDLVTPGSVGPLSVSFWCTLSGCIAKMGAVVQDLIPRCRLALSKIQQLAHSGARTGGLVFLDPINPESSVMSARISELTQLLSRGHLVGAGVLCPAELTSRSRILLPSKPGDVDISFDQVELTPSGSKIDDLTSVIKTIDALASVMRSNEFFDSENIKF